MEPDKIFSIFDKDFTPDMSSINFEEHPLYLIKMFLKIHQNKKNLSKSINQEELTEYVINIRAFHYLEKIDLDKNVSKDILQSQSSNELKLILNYSIKFFEKLEDYEKCAFLKKVIDIIS
jgi:hypothetical protein